MCPILSLTILSTLWPLKFQPNPPFSSALAPKISARASIQFHHHTIPYPLHHKPFDPHRYCQHVLSAHTSIFLSSNSYLPSPKSQLSLHSDPLPPQSLCHKPVDPHRYYLHLLSDVPCKSIAETSMDTMYQYVRH